MSLKNIITIFKREVGGYFNSSIAYIYLIGFIAINNGLFMTQFFLAGRADMAPYFDLLPFILLIFIPVITMRLWAEDRKENTFELLMTFPMKPAELVLGKFLAGLFFYIVSLASTFTIPLIMLFSGSPDTGRIISGYLGALCCGALFMSVGIFISGQTKEQIIAFVLTALSCFVLLVVGADFFTAFADGWIPGGGSFLKNYLAVSPHLISFNRGIIDIKDILYFLVMIFVFLLLNGLSFEGRLRPRAKIVFGSAVGVCLSGIIIFNWLTHDLSSGRFDVTQNKIYTVSEASRQILLNLKAPVRIKLYISPAEKMPTSIKTLEREITAKLDELRIASKNKLDFKVYYIEAANLVEANQKQKAPGAGPSNTLEQSLQAKGIIPFQVQSIDRDALGLRLVYSALTISYKEKSEEILPHILPQNLPDLEYLLLSRIVKMTLEARPKVALFAPLRSVAISPDEQRLIAASGKSAPQYADDYKTIPALIQNNGYDFERIALTKESPIPGGVSALLVINPQELSDKQIDSLDKFLAGGGSILVAAQGYNYSIQMAPPQGINIIPGKLNLDINKFLRKSGVGVNDKMLMDEDCQIVNLNTNQGAGPFTLTMPIKIPNQILVRQQAFDSKAALMNRLEPIFYLWGSSIDISDEAIKGANLEKTILFTSSPRSWLVPFGGAITDESLSFPKAGSPGRFPLGVMLKPAQRPGKLVLLGCSKMFDDQMITASPGNLGIFANIVDSFALGDSLVRIRSKALVNRDIKRLSDIQKVWYRFIAVGLVPLIWAIYAYIRLMLRRQEKNSYLSSIKGP